MKALRIVRNIVLVLVALALLLLVALQVVLRPKVLTPIVNGKIEGGAPDKVIYYRCPDDMLRGFRIHAGDLLLAGAGLGRLAQPRRPNPRSLRARLERGQRPPLRHFRTASTGRGAIHCARIGRGALLRDRSHG